MSAGPIGWVSDEQTAFRDSVVSFARTLGRHVASRDRSSDGFDPQDWRRLGAFGLLGLPVPHDLGGGGADAVTTLLGLDGLGYGCADGGLVFSAQAHLWSTVVPLWRFGSSGQQERWLPAAMSGQAIGCHAITEPEAGSDAFSLRTTAVRSGDGWVLNGRKAFVTNAPVAGLFVVFARTDPEAIGSFGVSSFVVEAGTPGLIVGAPAEKLGLRTSPLAEVTLEDCTVPFDAMLGGPGKGGAVFAESMRWERVAMMAAQTGVMERTLEDCVAHARERRQFGQPIGRFGSVAERIADMRVAVDASRALVLRVGWLMDQGHDTEVDAAVAKTFVSEAAARTHLGALQVHGGSGYLAESGIERLLRDALGGTIYSGTSEIQRRIIARSLGL